jgi:hypothetical protein
VDEGRITIQRKSNSTISIIKLPCMHAYCNPEVRGVVSQVDDRRSNSRPSRGLSTSRPAQTTGNIKVIETVTDQPAT